MSKKAMSRSSLMALALILAFTIAMPNQTMALWLFDQKDKPKEQSVLESAKIDIPKVQEVADATVGLGSVKNDVKQDRTKDHEIISKRTPFTSTYENKDGTKTMEYAVTQQNFKKGSSWEKIDNTLKAVQGELPTPNLFQSLANTKLEADPPREFSGKAGVVSTKIKPLSEGLQIEAAGKTLTIKPVGAKNVTPEQKDDKTVVYKDAWPYVDLEYELRGETIKEIIVLKSNKAQTEFNFDVSGGKVIDHPERKGELAIEGMPNEFSFSSLTLAVNQKGVISEERVTQTPSKKGITVQMDKDWLKSQSADSFPMKIDPSFGRDASSYWMFKSDGFSCGSSNCYANIGTINDGNWRHWRSYFQFPISDLAGKKIVDANLHGYYKTGENGIGDGRSIGMGHANCIAFNCLGYQVGGANNVGGDFDINFTGGLQTSVNNSDWGTVWSLWGEEGPYKSFKPYYNFRATVVYDNPTSQATAIEPANGQVTVSTQPTLRVNPATDADGDQIKYYFQVSTGVNGSGAIINSDWITATQWTIPDGILQDGNTYHWRVFTKGATQTDPNWSRSFKVDLRTGKDSTQAYDTVGPIGVDLATGNATTSTDTHSMSALGGTIGLSLNYNTPTKAKSGLVGEYWNVPQNYAFSSGAPNSPANFTRNDANINFNNRSILYTRWWGGRTVIPDE
ncbi:MAG: hypothetical protein EOO17_04120 [Chloroflexi bacterium]|nr:MAG: hypothetical protein EOO17_04120 [Chloroflexota bacterium]